MIELAHKLLVDVQIALSDTELDEGEEPPGVPQLTAWANAAYESISDVSSEVTIRLVDSDEIITLNRDYRHKDKATNVLSFPFEVAPGIDIALLGDIVICHSVIAKEAAQQGKSVNNHYAHMVTHGVLHLCGYDHQDDPAAEKMETLETNILAAQGIANPYH
jgi:probable rRNA maturation factor